MGQDYDGHSGELTLLDDEWRRQLGLPPLDRQADRQRRQSVPSRPRRNTNPQHVWQVTAPPRTAGMTYMQAFGLIREIQQRYRDRWCVHPEPLGWDARTWSVLIWPLSGEWRVYLPSADAFYTYDERRKRLNIDGQPGGVA